MPTPVEEASEPEPELIVDPVAVSPDVYKVILDGPRMRILEATWQPGQKDKPHGHPPLIAYAITEVFGLAYDVEDYVSIRIRQGRAFHQAAVASHYFENRSTNVAKMVIVELKQGQPTARIPDDAAPPAVTASPDIYELIMFDSTVRVLLATWKPGQKDELHGHPALTAYAITDVTGKLTDEEGKTTDVILKAGTALFQEPVKSHIFENVGEETAQLLLIEARK